MLLLAFGGCAGGKIHVPGIAREVRILAHEVDGAILGILPDGLVEAKSGLLDGAILAAR